MKGSVTPHTLCFYGQQFETSFLLNLGITQKSPFYPSFYKTEQNSLKPLEEVYFSTWRECRVHKKVAEGREGQEGVGLSGIKYQVSLLRVV